MDTPAAARAAFMAEMATLGRAPASEPAAAADKGDAASPPVAPADMAGKEGIG